MSELKETPTPVDEKKTGEEPEVKTEENSVENPEEKSVEKPEEKPKDNSKELAEENKEEGPEDLPDRIRNPGRFFRAGNRSRELLYDIYGGPAYQGSG